MPQDRWTTKRERQYGHVKAGIAEEIAARVVNKERARAGEAREASPSSVKDLSSSRRGGLRSHAGERGRTYAQLYNEAREHGIRGRSAMNKALLIKALSH